MALPHEHSSFAVDQVSFDELRQLLRNAAGLTLSEAKIPLVKSRLRGRLEELGFASLGAYLQYLRSLTRDDQEWQLLVNAMTTNKTAFFREPQHYDFLVEAIVPEHLKRGQDKPLAVWSAACSTGEEPYTLAMVLAMAAKQLRFDFQIAATDVDTDVLAHARNGVYGRDSLKEVPQAFHREAFSFGTGDIAQWVKVKSIIKDRVAFERCNLVETPYPWRNRFDVILCRNVMIYFSPDTIQLVTEGLYAAAAPGAFLLVGHSESLQNIRTRWQYVAPSVYRKPEGKT